MNAFKNTHKHDPEILADLLKIGMIDNFVTEFKRAASTLDSPEIPEFVTQINNCLHAQIVSQKRMQTRLELAESTDMSAPRVDVVTPCKFVGAGWPSRRTIVIEH